MTLLERIIETTSSAALRRLVCAALLLVTVAAARAATITVDSTADAAANDGQCTLREAIIAANTNTVSGATAGECAAGAAGLDMIAFAIPGAGVPTICTSAAARNIISGNTGADERQARSAARIGGLDNVIGGRFQEER